MKMRTPTAAISAALLLGGSLGFAQSAIRKEQVRFKAGESTAAIKGTLKGDETVDYILNARAGQSMVVNLESRNKSAYFNVTAAGEDSALFIGSTLGSRFEGELPKTGDYTVRLYLMRSAARRGETAPYTITFGVSSPAAPAAKGGFERTLELQGITFNVSCANDSSLPTVKIKPGKLEIDNSEITRQAEGHVVEAEVADLDVDGSPEVYVYVQSAGSGSYGSLIAYSANKRKSLSEIHVPPIASDPKAAKGYRGHDEFRVVESTLVRRFPVYRETDTNAKATGGMRQIQYKLAKGEASWVLRADKVVEF